MSMLEGAMAGHPDEVWLRKSADKVEEGSQQSVQEKRAAALALSSFENHCKGQGCCFPVNVRVQNSS